MGKVFIYSPISISLSPRDTSTYCPVSAISSSKASSNEYENFALISFLIISYKFHHSSKSNFMYLFFHPVTPDNITRIILNIKKRTHIIKEWRIRVIRIRHLFSILYMKYHHCFTFRKLHKLSHWVCQDKFLRSVHQSLSGFSKHYPPL